MARVQKVDRGMSTRLDEFEKRIFLLKISYEKYFAGIDAIEPIRERDELRRYLRDLIAMQVTNGRQKFRLQNLRARWSTMELYWTRNLVQIERGTHPKQKYKAEMKEKLRAELEAQARRLEAGHLPSHQEGADGAEGDEGEENLRPLGPAQTILPELAQARPRVPAPPPPPPEPARNEREEAGYRAVYDAYVRTRQSCGQTSELDYTMVRDTLKRQVEALKAKTQCSTVKFRVVVEEGKAKLKAVPVT